MEIQEYIQKQLVENDFAIAGVLSAVAYGILGHVKATVRFLYNRLVRLVRYEATIEQSDELYVAMNRWITKNYPNKLRNVEAFVKETYKNGWEEVKSDELLKVRHYSDFF